MALAFSALAFPMTADRGAGALPAALSAVWLGAILVLLGYFRLRRALGFGNLDFLKAFYGGLVMRFGLLLLAGLAVYFTKAWNLTVFLVSLALTYPLFLAFEAWRVSGEQPGNRRSHEGSS